MIKRVLFAAAWTAIVLQFKPALAAGPYDGTWTGMLEGNGTHCPPAAITMRIADNRITGNIVLSDGTPRLEGSVAADGSGTASYNYAYTGASGTVSGKFSGNEFIGKLDSIYKVANTSCSRSISAKRS